MAWRERERARRGFTSACVAAVLVAACSSSRPPAPVLRGVEPARAPGHVESRVRVLGENFTLDVSVRLDSDRPPELRSRYQLELVPASGAGRLIALADVTRDSITELSATVPARVPAGLYTLRLLAPGDRAVELAAAIEIYDPECMGNGQCMDADPCTVNERCVLGLCQADARDADDDGFVDAACGGDDCDDDPLGCGDECAPGLAEACDQRDNDCDDATPDGADEPGFGDPCDGADADTCAEGLATCALGAMTCTDLTGDSAEGGAGDPSCGDQIDNDCNGQTDNDDVACWAAQTCDQRIRLTLDGAPPTEPLIEFPLAVALDGARIDYAAARPDGADIRLYERDPLALDHEIERWDPAGQSTVWVRVPTVEALPQIHTVWLYYACADTVAPDPADVWDASFAGVWHLGPDLADSTGGGSDGTDAGTADAAGQLARAREFDGAASRIDMGGGGALAALGDVTLSAWARFDSLAAGAFGNGIGGYAGFADSAPANYHYALFLADDLRLTAFWEFGAGNDVLVTSTAAAAIAPGQFHHYAFTRDSAARLVRFYVDGAPLGAAVPYGQNPSNGGNAAFSVGRDPCCAGGFFDGAIDEVRVERAVRSSERLRVQHRAMTDALITYGNPESK